MKFPLIFFSICISSFSLAQNLDKEEKKELIKEIKLLKKSPEKYKFLKESAEVKDIIIIEQNNEIVVLKKDIQKKDMKLKQLNDSLQVAKEVRPQTDDCSLVNEGYKYRIQIGLFQNFDISALLNNPKFIIHEYVNGKHRYSVGNFNTLEEATIFKDELRRLGLDGAFVSEYNNGDRVMNTSSPVKNELNTSSYNNTTSNSTNNSEPVVVDPQKIYEMHNYDPNKVNIKIGK